MISRPVHPRPPLPRARAPLFRKQKQRAAGAKFWSNHCETGGFSCILATQATAQPPPYPIWTDPTDPARQPSDRPIGPLGPYSWAPLGLGLTALRARAPPGPPVFSVFVFSRPPAASDPLGRAQTERSKTLRPVWHRLKAHSHGPKPSPASLVVSIACLCMASVQWLIILKL